MIDKLFKIYKKNEINEIVKYKRDTFYDAFLAKTILYNKEVKHY